MPLKLNWTLKNCLYIYTKFLNTSYDIGYKELDTSSTLIVTWVQVSHTIFYPLSEKSLSHMYF